MGAVNDLTGRRFGRLKVIRLEQLRGHAYWRCECECGSRPVVRGSKLVAGLIQSCGCYRADPAVRRAAREQVPAAKRRRIALMGGEAFAAKMRRPARHRSE